MKTVLAIDQSTSATKAVLFDADGTLHDRTSLDHRQIYPQPGWVEHDAEEIWDNVLGVMKAIAGKHPDKVSGAACLSIANQRETIVVFDRETGKPLHHAIVWQCRRGDAICRELTEAGHAEEVRRKTGLVIDTYFSASKLRWLIENVPGLGAKLESGEALIGTIDSYLIYRLTGDARVHATDYTNASRTLLFDIGRLCWDKELAAMFGVPMAAVPEVRESAASFGEVSVEGLPPLPIRGVMGDSQASLFAQRCFEPGMAKVTFGTGSSILCNVGGTLPEPRDSIVTALAWVRDGRPVYALEGIINYSAATVAWLVDQLGLIESAEESEAFATAVPDNGGVYFVPAFSGLSAPHWDPSARAAIVGMTAHSTKNHVVRAALESIAYQVRDVLEAMEKDAGSRVDRLQADGGPTRNRFLMQFTANMTGARLSVSEIAESSALGAAMTGMLGSGVHASLEALAGLPRESLEFEPGMEASELERLWAGWQKAISQVMHGGTETNASE